jgi:superoxide dismutase, Cu-Zn family
MSQTLLRVLFLRAFVVLGAASAPIALAVATTPTPAPTAPASPTSGQRQSVIELAPASGSKVTGQITAVPMADGVHLTGTLRGFEAKSVHGFHVHEKGDCSSVDASSAGDHFNPSSAAHGKMGPGVHHAGDINNLVADDHGVAQVDVHLPGVSLGTGGATDIANRALVAHAVADDYTTQPAGNSGTRVACGVIPVPR